MIQLKFFWWALAGSPSTCTKKSPPHNNPQLWLAIIILIFCSLIQDRSLNLMDGTRLLDKKCYEATKASSALSDKEMSEM